MADRPLARIGVPVLIVLLAALLRVWSLGSLPPGLQFDEAHNAIDAARVLDGARPMFFPDNGGREPLVTYLHAPSLRLVGRENPAAALRLVSAVVGVLTVAALYGFARRFFADRLTAALSASFLAVSYWHLHFSRYGIRAILAPLWTTLALWAWWRVIGAPDEPSRDDAPPDMVPPDATPPDLGGSEASVPVADGTDRTAPPEPDSALRRAVTSRAAAAVLCGAFLAAAVYSHPSGRLLPLVLLAHAAYRTLATRGREAKRTWGGLALAGVTALVLFAPLGLYFLDNPVHFTGHPSDVSLSVVAEAQHDGSIGRALAANVAAVAGMFFVAGDPSTFHNLPHLPVFDPLTALLALIGVGVLIGALMSRSSGRRDRAVLLAVWLVVLLLPTVLSDRPPNYSRAIAALPAIVMLPALGLRWSLGRLPDLSGAARRAAIVVVVGAAALWTAWHYFSVFAGTPHVYYSYDVEKSDAYEVLVAKSDDATVFLHPLWLRHATINYLNRDGPIRELDSHDTLVLPADGRDVLYALPAKEAEREGWEDDLTSLLRGAGERNVVTDAQGNPALVTYRLPGSARGEGLSGTIAAGDQPASSRDERSRAGHENVLEPREPSSALFGNRIRLLGYSVGEARPGEPLTVELTWLAEKPLDDDLTVFVHLVDADGEPVGQQDREPGWASYRTSSWQTGDVVIDRFRPAISEDAKGPIRISVGWYDGRTGARLTTGNGDSISVGPYELAP